MNYTIDQLRNAVIEGNALSTLLDMPTGVFGGIITDMPYSSGGAFRGDRMSSTNTKYTSTDVVNVRPDFAGDNRDQRAFGYWCALWLGEALRVVKPGSPIVLFTDWRQLPTVTDALQAGGWVWRGIAVWNKGLGSRGTQGRFTNQCEYMVWGSAGEMSLDRPIGQAGRNLPGVFHCPVKQADKHHVTGKPTDLMRQVVKIVEPGEIILDFFAGSGTTGVAAKLEGYDYCLVELTKHYADVCRQRLGEVGDEVLLPALFSAPELVISEEGGLQL